VPARYKSVAEEGGNVKRDAADIASNVKTYLGMRGVDQRYSSYDYCFNYFSAVHESDESALRFTNGQMEIACLQLGFYLASWGMYRGSGQLIRHSARRLATTVETILMAPDEIWTIDADGYSIENRDTILQVAEDLRRTLPSPASDTLVTKIMLGVFGCVPALDSYFVRGFGLSSNRPLRASTLEAIADYAASRAASLSDQRIYTIDFASGAETLRRYPVAKIIDMVFFVEGSRARARPAR
jgi:hypothetical protein